MSIRTIDLDNKPVDERRINIPNYDTLNNVGLVELGRKVQAMTDEEKLVVAKNLPIDIMLNVIGSEFKRYVELESNLNGILARFDK